MNASAGGGKRWKILRTVVIRKPNRPDYWLLKAYRPIALMDMMGKILSACVEKRLTYKMEKNNLLPQGHFRGRPGRATTNASLLIMSFIMDVWRKGEVVSALYMDIQSAFPNINPEALYHKLKIRGIPEIYIC